MAGFDGNGNYLRSFSWVTDKANGVPITASRFDTEDNGFAAGLTLAVTRDGQGKPASNFLPVADQAYSLGSLALRWTSINGILTFSAANGITQSVPSSGVAYTGQGAANAYCTQWTANSTSGQSLGQLVKAGTTSADFASRIQNQAGTQDYQVIQGDGQGYTYAPAAATAGPAGTFQTGFMDAPQNSQTANYQLVLTDRGKQVTMNGSNLTLTIPANSGTAFPVGTVIAIVNLNATALSVAITTDTLTKAGSVTTGTRTVSQNGLCSLMKVAATSWLISGMGLS